MTTDTGQVEGRKEGYRVVREIGRRRNFDPHFPIVSKDFCVHARRLQQQGLRDPSTKATSW